MIKERRAGLTAGKSFALTTNASDVTMFLNSNKILVTK